jgi:hypothetical protein
VKDAVVLEETPTYRLSGKTGLVGLEAAGDSELGWLVGSVERGADVHFFAMNIEFHSNEQIAEAYSHHTPGPDTGGSARRFPPEDGCVLAHHEHTLGARAPGFFSPPHERPRLSTDHKKRSGCR